MGHPGSHGEPVQLPSGEDYDVMLVGVKGCSTTTCLAGWAAALSGWHPTVWTNGDTTLLDWEVVAPVSLIPSDHYSTELVYDLARALLEGARVGTTPGIDFGAAAEGMLRFCYAVGAPALDEALERLAAVLPGLEGEARTGGET